MSPASPLELVSARRADRIAWTTYEKGMRNVYTAAAPDFRPVRLTKFLEDDGIDVSDVNISDDGSIIVFVRGSAPNRDGWIANPRHDREGGSRAIWAARASGGAAWKVADGGAPELSPDGRFVAWIRDGQVYRARVAPSTGQRDSVDLGLKPFIRAWGTQRTLRWSPDGTKLAFVSTRGTHSFIAVHVAGGRSITYLDPSVDFDDAPAWSPDGREIVFVRRPGQAFGQQPQVTSAPPGAGGRSLCVTAAGGPQAAALADSARLRLEPPGLCRGVFDGGHTIKLMVANVATGRARELWHNAPRDPVFANINTLHWADGHVVFPLSPPADEWERYYSISIGATNPVPIVLTTTDGMIEDATSAALSKDGRTLFYATNAGDIEKRHIWAVPVSGGAPRQLTKRAIETTPQPLASGRQLAHLYFDERTPASVALSAADGGDPRLIFPRLGAGFPTAAHVAPQIVHFNSPDGARISNQLFLPADLRPGERRPAMVFVHGGPMRQMLPGYHYMQFYHWAYAYNQWLASQGYVVLSVNFRSGVGYGRSFRFAPNTGQRGSSEYQDVLAAGRYLEARSDVDPRRIGIWGLSYGGILTAQALARNSDLFVAGADLAGVHFWGSSFDSTSVAYRSSAISAIDAWKSPVFLVHGDDDRNVAFSQTVGLVQLLRARNIYHELMVIPDDLHESMFHSIWLDTWERMGQFFGRFVRDRQAVPAADRR
ncbi:MAG: S9 family peptidase [Gemmatimonadota bacterium]